MRFTRMALVGGLAIAATTVGLSASGSALTGTSDLTTQTAEQVAQSLVGPGVSISNVSYTGTDISAGTFSGGEASIGFGSGVTLSSGDIASWVGPTNTNPGFTTVLGTSGDPDLDALSGFTTFDATVLEFDFTADAETVFFRYVFGSEEYNNYVNTSFNDTFAFFVNGVNCATVPDSVGGTLPVSINTINNGGPIVPDGPGDGTDATNPDLYRDNAVFDGTNPYPTELDGLTVELTCMANVNPAPAVNTMKLAIADASDQILDSAVFIEEGSLTTTPPGCAKVNGGGRLDVEDGFVTLGGVAINDEQGLRGNLQVNDHRIGARFHGSTVDSIVVTDNEAVWTGEGSLNGEDGYTFEATITDNRNGNARKKGAPDTVAIVISDDDGPVWTLDTTDLTKGNFKIHECEEEEAAPAT